MICQESNSVHLILFYLKKYVNFRMLSGSRFRLKYVNSCSYDAGHISQNNSSQVISPVEHKSGDAGHDLLPKFILWALVYWTVLMFYIIFMIRFGCSVRPWYQPTTRNRQEGRSKTQTCSIWIHIDQDESQSQPEDQCHPTKSCFSVLIFSSWNI